MIMKESDSRFIGYGAMLIEGLVGIIALIAACSLHPEDYFAINVLPAKFATLNMTPVNLDELAREVGETIAVRPGGAVSLAVGFAQIFSAIPGMKSLMSYWYHFAIMFEALFILTTIDAGTRVGRFLVQEFLGKFHKPFERTNWWPGALISTGVIVISWAYFIHTGNVSTIWPMFGVANQLLAVVALSVVSTAIINAGKQKYVWVTGIPLLFVATTTLTAGVINITDNFWPLTNDPSTASQGYVNSFLTLIIIICAIIILIDSIKKWYRVLVKKEFVIDGKVVDGSAPGFVPPGYGLG
jgi:carbon starvation protein